MVTGEDESSSGAEEAEERCRFIAAESRRHCGYSGSETMSFRSEVNESRISLFRELFFSLWFLLPC